MALIDRTDNKENVLFKLLIGNYCTIYDMDDMQFRRWDFFIVESVYGGRMHYVPADKT